MQSETLTTRLFSLLSAATVNIRLFISITLDAATVNIRFYSIHNAATINI